MSYLWNKIDELEYTARGAMAARLDRKFHNPRLGAAYKIYADGVEFLVKELKLDYELEAEAMAALMMQSEKSSESSKTP